MDLPPLETLQQFISLLLSRHRAIRHHQNEDLSLVYADALLRHALVRLQLGDFPAQVVVIGPTQAGKSTIVNLLLAAEAATASPLAGYTRHAQGFSAAAIDEHLLAGVDSLLAGLARVDCAQLDEAQLDQFCLRRVDGTEPFAASAVLWDTPDFDSVSSRGYRSTVPMLCAMADLIVLVVSKDKYADQSVWETLRLIDPIRRPLLACINKVPATAAHEFEAILRDKFDSENIHCDAIVALPYQAQHATGALIGSDAAQRLRQACAAHGAPADRDDVQRIKAFLRSHWQQWVAPLSAERQAREQWRALIEAALNDARERYESGYLRDPLYAETMQQAMTRLLELMEIPGLAKSLARVRQAITWPARTLGGLLKRQPPPADAAPEIDEETRILREAIHHALLQLAHEAAEQAAMAPEPSRRWWRRLWQALQQEQASIQAQAEGRIGAYQQAFRPRIQQAAQQLYQNLQAHPAKLNALRAARTTADAAAIALALKTGGIGLNDLVLAPAMLSFTSMLTEGAVGQYLRRVEEQLKQQQLAAVEQHLLHGLRDTLMALTEEMAHEGLYALPPDALPRAEEALEKL